MWNHLWYFVPATPHKSHIIGSLAPWEDCVFTYLDPPFKRITCQVTPNGLSFWWIFLKGDQNVTPRVSSRDSKVKRLPMASSRNISPSLSTRMAEIPRGEISNQKTTWMSQEVSKRLVSGLYPQYTTFISRF